ncbi:cache domain-containing sensor histidine kinase [Salibacterium aidingense]|uniref:cache domain-containing sensor histidine kinase n=1 Tax=Salibacterium aidingense TaxID=384933 RepID=UPI003BDBD704
MLFTMNGWEVLKMRKRLKINNWSLKWKSIFILLTVTTLPIAAIIVMFFYQFNNILQQQVLDTSQRNLSSMESNLQSVLRDIEDISEYIIFSGEFRDYMSLSTDAVSQSEISSLEDNLRGFFTFHLTNKDYFHSMTISGSNGLTLNLGENVNSTESKWRKLAENRGGSVLWTDPYTVKTGWPAETERVISLFRNINNIYDINENLGEVRIRLSERDLYDYVIGDVTDNPHNAFIVRENGMVMSHENKERAGNSYPDESFLEQIRDSGQTTFQHSFEDETFYVVSEKVEDFYIVSMVSREFILGELSEVRRSSQYIVLGTVLLGITAIIGFFLTVLKPILELTAKTKRVEKGDFQARVEVRSSDEIGRLGRRFNKMVAEVQHLIDSTYKLEIQNKESELKALQSQINPHFLYNTLDMIRWSARLEQAAETGKSIEDLSRLFRISLSQGDLWIPLESEMKNVHSYLELQKRRMGGQLSFLLLKESGTEQALVMKIILQPLVENSISHGFRQHSANNFIYVRTYREERDLVLDVIDNGIGMDADIMNQMFSELNHTWEGYALRNIHNRIQHAFGNNYGIRAFPNHDFGGAFFRLRFPYIEDKKKLQQRLKGENHERRTD